MGEHLWWWFTCDIAVVTCSVYTGQYKIGHTLSPTTALLSAAVVLWKMISIYR